MPPQTPSNITWSVLQVPSAEGTDTLPETIQALSDAGYTILSVSSTSPPNALWIVAYKSVT